jgi:hypothetical protein
MDDVKSSFFLFPPSWRSHSWTFTYFFFHEWILQDKAEANWSWPWGSPKVLWDFDRREQEIAKGVARVESY